MFSKVYLAQIANSIYNKLINKDKKQLAVFVPQHFSEELLCPKLDPINKDAPELNYSEKDFGFEKSMETIPHHKKTTNKAVNLLMNNGRLKSMEEFYISIPNGISILEGTILKQNAIILKQTYELSMAKSPVNDKALNLAKSNYQTARHKFCSFIENTMAVD